MSGLYSFAVFMKLLFGDLELVKTNSSVDFTALYTSVSVFGNSLFFEIITAVFLSTVSKYCRPETLSYFSLLDYVNSKDDRNLFILAKNTLYGSPDQ